MKTKTITALKKKGLHKSNEHQYINALKKRSSSFL
ncbi:hypothetical protein J2S19_000569 [Metabacillus malikii]|uniref:Fur-regulated basic protein FbpA n=1 Tax=Metabacillus malikii TaxID=1504265 RepID=A0ABT9ZAP0_9BACI|nr:hypothetical protein [Metabacillus malikii]